MKRARREPETFLLLRGEIDQRDARQLEFAKNYMKKIDKIFKRAQKKTERSRNAEPCNVHEIKIKASTGRGRTRKIHLSWRVKIKAMVEHNNKK